VFTENREIILINIISIVIIIDVFGTCCQESWPMVPASGADHWCCSVLLACGVNSASQWCWPVVLPNVAVQLAGQLGKCICAACTLMHGHDRMYCHFIITITILIMIIIIIIITIINNTKILFIVISVISIILAGVLANDAGQWC